MRGRRYLAAGMAALMAMGAFSFNVSAEETVELTFMGWEASPLETEAVEAGIASFEAAHPNIKVNYTTVPASDYSAKLLAAAASGTLPDCMFMQALDYRTFAAKDLIMDMTDLFDEEFSLDDFIDSSSEIMDIDGKVYGVAACTVMPIVFYNKDVFDAAGLEYPSADPENCWTMDEFREIAKQLTTDDVYGCYGLEDEGAWTALTNENEGHYFNEDYSAPDFDSEENEEVFSIIKAVRTEDGSSPDASTLESVGMTAIQMLETGKVAMLVNGSWALQELAASDVNVGKAPLPSLKQASSTGCSHLHCISADTEHPEEAWEFIKWLSGEEYQGSLISSGLWMPNRKSWYTEEGLEKWYNEDVHGEDYRYMLDYFQNAEPDERAFQISTKCADIIREEITVYLQQDGDLGEALSNAQTRMTEAMAEASENLGQAE